jgi:hypothetical protein
MARWTTNPVVADSDPTEADGQHDDGEGQAAEEPGQGSVPQGAYRPGGGSLLLPDRGGVGQQRTRQRVGATGQCGERRAEQQIARHGGKVASDLVGRPRGRLTGQERRDCEGSHDPEKEPEDEAADRRRAGAAFGVRVERGVGHPREAAYRQDGDPRPGVGAAREHAAVHA